MLDYGVLHGEQLRKGHHFICVVRFQFIFLFFKFLYLLRGHICFVGVYSKLVIIFAEFICNL